LLYTEVEQWLDQHFSANASPRLGTSCQMKLSMPHQLICSTSGYATWFTAGGAIRIAHYDVIDDVITRKL